MSTLLSLFSVMLVPSISLYIIALRRGEKLVFSAAFIVECIICAVINRVISTVLAAWIDRLLHIGIEADSMLYMVIASLSAVCMAFLYEIILKSFNIKLEIKGNKE